MNPDPASTEVREFHSIDDLLVTVESIQDKNVDETIQENNSNGPERTADRNNSAAVQTDFPNILVPQLQRKRERKFLTAKPISMT